MQAGCHVRARVALYVELEAAVRTYILFNWTKSGRDVASAMAKE